MDDVIVTLGAARYRLRYTGRYVSGMGWGFRLYHENGPAPTTQLVYVWKFINVEGQWCWQINHDAQCYADAGALVAGVVARQAVAA